MTEHDLLKLHLINSIDSNIEAYVFYQLLVKPDGSSRFLYLSNQIENYNANPIEEIKNNPRLLYDYETMR